MDTVARKAYADKLQERLQAGHARKKDKREGNAER